MLARGAAVLLAGVLAGCAGPAFGDLDPMAIACTDTRVRDVGWCDHGFALAPAQQGGSSAPASAPDTRIEGSADHITWTGDLDGHYGRSSFVWTSPGRAALAWSASGSGGMSVAVQDGGTMIYRSAAGAGRGSEELGGRAAPWTVLLDFDNFRGEARVTLRAR